jgi:hypothetical protein
MLPSFWLFLLPLSKAIDFALLCCAATRVVRDRLLAAQNVP